MKWSEEAKALVRELHATGINYRAVAAKVNAAFGTKYSRLAVAGIVSRMGLKHTTIDSNGFLVEKERAYTVPPRVSQPLRAHLDEQWPYDPAPDSIKLMDAKRDQCRWPVGQTNGRDMMVCGHKVKQGKAYCPEHYRDSIER